MYSVTARATVSGLGNVVLALSMYTERIRHPSFPVFLLLFGL